MKTVNSLGIDTLKRLGRKLKVKKFNIDPQDVNKLNPDVSLEVPAEIANDPDCKAIIYLWDWYKGITKIERSCGSIGEAIESAGLARFSHVAIHLPGVKLLQIHFFNEGNLITWRTERDWELSGGDKDLTVLSSNSYGG